MAQGHRPDRVGDQIRQELFNALRVYQGRHRRFGAVATPDPTGPPEARARSAEVRAEPTRSAAGSPGGGA